MRSKKNIDVILILFLFGCFVQPGFGQISKSEKEFQFAKKLYDDNLLVLSAEQFQQYVEAYPNTENSDNAQFLSGKAYFSTGKYKKAFNAFKRLELDYPQSFFLSEGRFRLAESQFALENFPAAAELFKRVAYFHSESEYAPLALFQSGVTFKNIKEHKKAKDSFYQLISRYPDSPQRIEAHLAIVNLHFEQEELKDALHQIDGIFQAFGGDANDPRVYWLRAEIFRNLAQFDEAEKNYSALVEKYPKDSFAGRANYQLGLLSFEKGDYNEALRFFNLVTTPLSDELMADISLKKAEALVQLNKLPEAKAVLEKAGSLKNAKTPELAYNLALVTNNLKEPEQAETILNKLLAADGVVETDLRFKAIMLLIDVLEQQSKYQQALSIIIEHNEKLTTPQQAKLLFKKAEILQTRTNDYAAAIREYDSFVEHFPQDDKIDDAQFQLAACYLKLAEYRIALNEYEKYLVRYQAGDFFKQATDKINTIKNAINFSRSDGFTEIADLFKRFVEKDPLNLDFKLGEVYYNNKNFLAAVEHFKQASGNEISIAGQSNFLLGKSYLGLSDLAELEGHLQLAKSYSDSATITFLNLAQDSTGRNEEAAFFIAKAILRDTTKIDLTPYENWQTRFPDSQFSAAIKYELATRILRNDNSNSTTTETALQLYENILQNDKSEFGEQAALKKLECLSILKNDSLVLVLGDQFPADYPESHYAVEVLFMAATSAFNLNELNKSKGYLQKIIDSYFYSNFAQKAKVKLARIFIENKEYRSALDYYNSIFSDDINVLYNKAFVYENLNFINQALAGYIKFISNSPNSSAKIKAQFAVGRLAAQTNNLYLAQEYYTGILNSPGNAAVKLQANFAIGDILFQKKLYEEAKQYYTAAFQFADTDSVGKRAGAGLIRCLYKLKAFAQADAEVKKFKKRFNDTKEYEAQLLLDKGDALAADKSFPEAEKVYKKLRGNYKKTDWGAHGEFGLGAVYLVTNHTEDALKILTGIPEKYPDSKVTPLAYYNLGDFYYKSQQVESAIHAFKKVREHELAGDLNERALLYLIQCYQDARFYDQAIVVTREFLDAYPESEHAFRKKIDMAQFLMNLKEFDRAIKNFRALLPFADKDTEAEIQFYIAQSYKDVGNYTRAAVEYLKVKYLTQPGKLPWHVTALFESGRCLVKLNQLEQAGKIFKRIVRERGSESSFGRFALKQLQELEDVNSATKIEN